MILDPSRIRQSKSNVGCSPCANGSAWASIRLTSGSEVLAWNANATWCRSVQTAVNGNRSLAVRGAESGTANGVKPLSIAGYRRSSSSINTAPVRASAPQRYSRRVFQFPRIIFPTLQIQHLVLRAARGDAAAQFAEEVESVRGQDGQKTERALLQFPVGIEQLQDRALVTVDHSRAE